MSELLSLTEAAAIAELSPEIIRTALEKNSLSLSRRRKVGKAVRHEFTLDDVFLLKLLAEFPFPLSREDKSALKLLIHRKADACGPWRVQGADFVFCLGDITFIAECKLVKNRLSRNFEVFKRGEGRIISDPDVLNGTPVFRGTRIPLSHVAELFRKGVSEKEITEDFPQLSQPDLEYAKLYSRIGERPGRPRKRLQIRKQHRAA